MRRRGRERQTGTAGWAFLAVWTVAICLPRAMPGQTGTVGEGPRTTGLALRGMRWDAVLRRSWAVYWDPGHPERPAVAVPVAGEAGTVEPIAAGIGDPLAQFAAAGARPQPVVHAGDRVLLWREERNLRLQLTAVAEQSGAVGELIRVRIPGASWAGGMQADQPVRGRVRGAAEVEMEP